MKASSQTALDLAFGKGRVKKWALETVLLDTLYDTDKSNALYLKLKDISNIKADIETEEELILRYGYLYRIPKTELNLHIIKKNHLMYLTKVGVGYGYDNVEKIIIDFLMDQKKKENLYWRTNYNFEEYKIK